MFLSYTLCFYFLLISVRHINFKPNKPALKAFSLKMLYSLDALFLIKCLAKHNKDTATLRGINQIRFLATGYTLLTPYKIISFVCINVIQIIDKCFEKRKTPNKCQEAIMYTRNVKNLYWNAFYSVQQITVCIQFAIILQHVLSRRSIIEKLRYLLFRLKEEKTKTTIFFKDF